MPFRAEPSAGWSVSDVVLLDLRRHIAVFDSSISRSLNRLANSSTPSKAAEMIEMENVKV